MTEKKSLEELRKIRDKLKNDLSDLQYEEQMILASISNIEHMTLMNELRNVNKPPQHLLNLAKQQKIRKLETEQNSEVNENKLIYYYTILTGIIVNKASVKALPISEDTSDKCVYLYEFNANVESLRFNLSYRSDKPPEKDKQAKENIKQLTITLERSLYQKEIQDGLDFFLERPIIPSAILFLKSVNKLVTIRKNICNELLSKYEKYFQISVNDKGFVLIKCTGILQPDNNFTITWHVKFDEATLSGKDAFMITAMLQDTQLEEDIQPVFKQIIKHLQWKDLEYKEKLQLFVRTAIALVAADTNKLSSDNDTIVSEYSSIA